MSFLAKLFTKNKKLQIDFCEKNLDSFLKEEHFSDFQIFLNQKNITYKEYQCQSKCKECKSSPYAIVNGEFVVANDVPELLDKLKQRQQS